MTPGVRRLQDAIETEAKLAADDGFELPEVDGAVAGLAGAPKPPRTLEATYFDAPDLRLVRAGFSLRHRLGDGDDDGTWTLKLPAGHPRDGALRRRELTVRGAIDDLPPQLATLVRPWLRTAALDPVARLRTERRPLALVLDGQPVGEVVDDHVEVLADGAPARRFRELEVEASDDGVRDAVVARLQAAGAGQVDATPKHRRALGPAAAAPSDLAVTDLGPRSSAVDVLRAGMARAALRIVEHDAVIRTGRDPEGPHQARVACRRLRSDLRTLAPLVDAGWATSLRSELRWLAAELGAMRDLDVLSARLHTAAERLHGEERAAADAVLSRLAHERTRAFERAVTALDSDRYLALLDQLVDGAREPATLPGATEKAADVLPPLAAKAFGGLRAAAKRTGAHGSDEALHDLRIRAKRARYAADLAAPVVRAPAKRLSSALGGLQDVLGDHHDAVVAARWLRGAVPSATRAQAFALGLLVADEERAAREGRERWRTAWRAVNRKKLTSWMS